MSDESVRSYKSSLLIYNAYLTTNKLNITKADRDVLRSFIKYLREEREISYKTLENYLAALSSFYSYLEYEKIVSRNPVLAVRKRYLRTYKNNNNVNERKLLTVEEMGFLVNSISDIRDKAVAD